jgi:hypothetical protein
MALFLNEIEVSQPKLPFGLLSIPVLLMRIEEGPPKQALLSVDWG